jgi:glutamine synthetase
MKTAHTIAKVVQERGVEFFLCSFVEMSGAPKAKVVPAHHLEDMAQGAWALLALPLATSATVLPMPSHRS